jgi:hypothetical protein
MRSFGLGRSDCRASAEKCRQDDGATEPAVHRQRGSKQLRRSSQCSFHWICDCVEHVPASRDGIQRRQAAALQRLRGDANARMIGSTVAKQLRRAQRAVPLRRNCKGEMDGQRVAKQLRRARLIPPARLTVEPGAPVNAWTRGSRRRRRRPRPRRSRSRCGAGVARMCLLWRR